MNRYLVESTYGRFCIKFPQSRMKGEQHRLSPQQEIPNISSENRVRSIWTFPNEKKNIFVKKQRILMNFHIISAYNSEISSELSEYSGKKFVIIRILRKKFGIVRIDLGKKFGIVRILRMTSEKNSEFRIKVGNYHPYSENIVRFGNYSKLVRRKFPHQLCHFQNYIRTKILYKFFYT